MRTFVNERGPHPKDCSCGFCQRKGKIHLRGKDKEASENEGDEKKPTAESIVDKMLDEG